MSKKVDVNSFANINSSIKIEKEKELDNDSFEL